MTRDLKVGSGEIRERRSQIKNGVRIQNRKLKLGTTYLAALFPWDRLAALPRNGGALLLRVVEAVLFRHIVALLVPNHVARLRWHVLALLSLHLRFGAACICPCVCIRIWKYLSGNNSALLGGNVAADRTRAGGALLPEKDVGSVCEIVLMGF